MICEICGKRMWFWQAPVIACDNLGNLTPIGHAKCYYKLEGDSYFEKKKLKGVKK